VLDELRRRGHLTLDTDYDGWVLADCSIMSSCSAHHSTSWSSVSAPGRTTPTARPQTKRAEIEHYLDTVQPLLQRGASVELDGQRPASELAGLVEDLANRTHVNMDPGAN
jgi:hypothetical protein